MKVENNKIESAARESTESKNCMRLLWEVNISPSGRKLPAMLKQKNRLRLRSFPITLVYLLLTVSCLGQDIDSYSGEPVQDKYYIENKLIKKNRIHYIIDSSEFIYPGKFKIILYDTAGRLIGETYHQVDSFHTPYEYVKSGDTTFRLKYIQGTKKLGCYERFVHNNNGKIQSYLNCCNYYPAGDSYYVEFKAFYYDELNRLIAELSYINSEYPGKVADRAPINPASLRLNDVVYYSYKTMKNGYRLKIAKQALGDPNWRNTDTTIYDRQNRVLRFNSFARRGTTGEMVFNNLNKITEFVYKDSDLTITEYHTTCIALLYDKECLGQEQSDKNITTFLYNKDRTKKAVYGFYFNGEKYLRDKYSYVYYPSSR